MVVVIGLGSDIGRELALRFASDGWTVKGTYRTQAGLAGLPQSVGSTRCDLASAESISHALEWLRTHCEGWRLIVVAAGTEEPVGSFWDCNADEWDRGMQINALAPLRLIRGLYPIRHKDGSPSVALFSGAGTNGAAPAYSAYCASKVMLIKMCELLDAESADTSHFIIGPGIVRTKIHEETLQAGARAGANLKKVTSFLESRDPGTSHDEIYSCLRWCMAAGKKAVGGRNISLVHDAWRQGDGLARWLESDQNNYKLRRFSNEHRIKTD